MEKIDKLDKKILSILSTNARIPFKDVAAECGVSRAAIHQRVQKLIEDGIITGSGFDVNPKSLGYSTCTYVGINLERGSMYKDVVKQLMDIPEIVECHFTTGTYTMLLKCYARDNEHLMNLLNNNGAYDEYMHLTEDHIYGMLYYLTGMCHINWTEYENV